MKFTFPPESKPLPGFTIKRAIHRGGFGEVYYGLTDAGKEVALKLLNQHTDVELRGATACLNLNHPNLVTIYDIKSDADGDHWIVMEYVGGKRLADVLEDRGRLPVEEIERWLDGMTAGLSFLHERGIVHRDLKPSNVFSEGGVVKVGDVGLSKFISESRKSAHTQSVGTVYYMAPEVARGRYGREVDVYALGIMLYEMLTGEVPFDGESTGEILMKHLSSPPDLEKLPARLRPVIARSLEKDPQRRTSTVDRLRDEFKAAVRGRQVARDEPHDIPEHAFLDRSPPAPAGGAGVFDRQSYADARRPDAVRYAAAAHTDAQAYAQRARDQARWQAEQLRRRKHSCQSRARYAYREANRHWPRSRPGEKNWTPMLVIGAVAMFLLFTRAGRGMMPSLWEGAILAALAYGVYSFVKWMTPVSSPAPTRTPHNHGVSAPSMPVAARAVQSPPVAPRRPPVPTPDTPRKIAVRERASQLTGSMTVAAFASSVITAALAALGFVKDVPSALLFGGTAIFGSWAVLSAGKSIEGTSMDKSIRRLWQAAVGLPVGAAAYGLDQFLLVDFHPSGMDGRYYGFVTDVGDLRFASSTGEPTLAAYLAFFGMLFLLRRWWWQADAYRPKRLKVSSALFTALLGYVLTAIVYFPHAWGIVWAVVISCVVQLAAAWTPPEDRRPTEQPAA
ncbi:MAG: serine/threonine protein kinase [Planctomycetaceae bacterium]|nr:serine/threonine protein kinase [Planctomycetaceae bacterium]